ncbi:MAG: hypothetical protein ABI629_25410, partial [bacterium]
QSAPRRSGAFAEALVEARHDKARFRHLAAQQMLAGPFRPLRAAGAPPPRPATPVPDQPMRNKFCTVTFDAAAKLTHLVAGADVALKKDRIAAMLDPRAWDQGEGIISKAFRVDARRDGQYVPIDDSEGMPLGTDWKGSNLLYEYARSDIASFENILSIDGFRVRRGHVAMRYSLHDCLKCTIGFATAAGGLRRNEGSVEAVQLDATWWTITVIKDIRVRDLTPTDPGNRYDLGELVNANMGAALSLWIDDTSMMTPFS